MISNPSADSKSGSVALTLYDSPIFADVLKKVKEIPDARYSPGKLSLHDHEFSFKKRAGKKIGILPDKVPPASAKTAHRRYDSVNPTASKLLSKRWDDITQIKHW